MKKFWVKKVLGVIVFGSLAIVAVGFLVMALWNHILVAVLGVKAITYCQALGIFVLSKLLFGGFKGRGCGPSWGRGREMKEKWMNMTPEEREKFKQNWRSRCRTWGGKEE
jgi:hypothetical protein